MHDDLPKFPTPKEAFGKPPVSAYKPVSNIPKPPQSNRYRQVSGERASTPQEVPQRSTSQPQQYRPQPPVQQYQQPPVQYQQPPVQYQQPPVQQYQQYQRPPPPQQYHTPPPMQYQQPQMQQYQQRPPPAIPPKQPPTQPQQRPQPPTQQRPPPQRQPPTQPPTQPPAQHQPPYQDSTNSTPEPVDLRALFDDVDRRKQGFLSERELSKALVNGDYTLFDAHTVRLMMKMFDLDGDGRIYFAEFGQLWKYLHDWRQVFDKFDTNKSDRISHDEFSRALKAFGYNLSANCEEFMFKAGSKLNRQGEREMSFDMFVQSCISIKSITDTFKKYDTDRDGYVTISFEDYLIETTKLH